MASVRPSRAKQPMGWQKAKGNSAQLPLSTRRRRPGVSSVSIRCHDGCARHHLALIGKVEHVELGHRTTVLVQQKLVELARFGLAFLGPDAADFPIAMRLGDIGLTDRQHFLADRQAILDRGGFGLGKSRHRQCDQPGHKRCHQRDAERILN